MPKHCARPWRFPDGAFPPVTIAMNGPFHDAAALCNSRRLFQALADIRDWSKVTDRVDLTVFEKPFKSEAEAAFALKEFEIILAMRERTAFPKSLFAALPKLKLMITSGMRNAAIDFEAAKAHNVVLCGTTRA